MDPKWSVAFSNITVTEYAGLTFKEYYSSPAVAMEAQLKAAEIAEKRFGLGKFLKPFMDTPYSTLSSLLGMKVVFPEPDGVPSIDVTRPPINDVADAEKLHIGNPETDGVMPLCVAAWRYYKVQGPLGGSDGSILTTASEVTGNSIMAGLLENPQAACRVLDVVLEAHRVLERFGLSVSGQASDYGYVADDFAGLLSPAAFREFLIPRYQKIYAGKSPRMHHSELLRAEHLRIARDLLGITDFHGAGAVNLTLSEMNEIMGHDFWTQLIPHELYSCTPEQIRERIKVLAGCGCHTVQLYPGRGTPPRNLEAAVAAAQQECPGGPRV